MCIPEVKRRFEKRWSDRQSVASQECGGQAGRRAGWEGSGARLREGGRRGCNHGSVSTNVEVSACGVSGRRSIRPLHSYNAFVTRSGGVAPPHTSCGAAESGMRGLGQMRAGVGSPVFSHNVPVCGAPRGRCGQLPRPACPLS
ncbi:hypothetical protein E2C01_000487 [Portunus trituberculatus]|uniref:Uncharacterized protein n=1 Tax=Portunus trituberculatus TaxID=210409 RepID=A0A5B7CFD9_PORTR|nr:hypothetical protein [Portunus trituberculatus]